MSTPDREGRRREGATAPGRASLLPVDQQHGVAREEHLEDDRLLGIAPLAGDDRPRGDALAEHGCRPRALRQPALDGSPMPWTTTAYPAALPATSNEHHLHLVFRKTCRPHRCRSHDD